MEVSLLSRQSTEQSTGRAALLGIASSAILGHRSDPNLKLCLLDETVRLLVLLLLR